MNLKFILAQIIGTIALVILIISFQKNKKEILLKYQIISSLLYAMQYFLLNAYTGVFMNLISMIRNYIFNKYREKKVPIYWLLIFVIIMITLSLISYNGVTSLLPMIAVVIYSCAIWNGNLKYVRMVEVISCILFAIYNIKVLAISGLIATIIEMTAAIIAIYRFDIKKELQICNSFYISLVSSGSLETDSSFSLFE